MGSEAIPLVSIVIPVFRQGRYLQAAVDSCLGQTYSAVQVIVVNDGSDDDTELIARAYGDKIVYVRQTNAGVSAARNTGIARSEGRYLKFLDADDYLHAEQIERQVSALRDRSNCVSFTALRNFYDEAPERHWDHVPAIKSLIPDIFGDHDGCAPHNMLLPCEMVRALKGFNESLSYTADWEFACRLGMLAPEVIMDTRVGGFYRRHSGSLSTNQTAMLKDYVRSLLGVHDLLRAAPRREWFGVELLRAEQNAYRGVLMASARDQELLVALQSRIQELHRLHGLGHVPGKARVFARVLGYDRAERLRAWILRVARRRSETRHTCTNQAISGSRNR